MLFPGDFVTFPEVDLDIGPVNKVRIIFIGGDHRNSNTRGQVLVKIQAVVSTRQLQFYTPRMALVCRYITVAHRDELFLMEDSVFLLPASEVISHLSVFLDKKYRFPGDPNETSQESGEVDEGTSILEYQGDYFMRHVVSSMAPFCKFVEKFPPTNAELKIYEFGRQYLIDMFVTRKVIFPPSLFSWMILEFTETYIDL